MNGYIPFKVQQLFFEQRKPLLLIPGPPVLPS